MSDRSELITIHSAGNDTATAPNGAPRHDPQTWDPSVVEDSPLLGHTPAPEHVYPDAAPSTFSVEAYLAEERGKDLLRFSTAGSVDDGKSTLIGRLLYDTQSVYDDQVRSIEGKGTTAPGVLDLALLTDGLRAEREQGITIDVAYRYFATPHRKFIIADTPGHEQYTRNMATGASTADVAIVLVDARKGVLRQSRRHAYITALLGVRNVIVAVNKMDLVDWSEEVFREICEQFRLFFTSLDIGEELTARLHFIPVSALAGDNVVSESQAMPWYDGPTLLALLESLPSSSHSDADAPFRFAVQRITRPNLDFRGFAGQISAGTVRPGDKVRALPSGQSSRIARIVTYGGDLVEATAPLSVTLTLEDEIDISRGDLLVAPEQAPHTTTHFEASLVWMDQAPLDVSRRYLLKQTSRTVQAYVRSLLRTVDLENPDSAAVAESAPVARSLAINSIGMVAIETLLPISLDSYAANRHMGSFILIDAQSNATVAAGMVRRIADEPGAGSPAESTTQAPTDLSGAETNDGAVTLEERSQRWGHVGALLTITASGTFATKAVANSIANLVERTLFERGAFIVRSALSEVAAAGALALTVREQAVGDVQAEARIQLHVQRGETALSQTLAPDPQRALAQALALLTQANILAQEELS
ncbi:sulfate adenylyltransferase subunit CysN [Acidipila sp. EB88]|uniref:sulfate adenylyltransferase subunit CysN n=1 Tax=Acidipila sp. EB88 TaxID=2305226 RepID=UPI000F5EDF8E|nr:sulfate adenylyltransferase subunit CysN [Acidipila sp. EB88]RRA49114.1 sulfate adenylyltransferase subunit CysN [Acidipila sp. EB88]